MNTSDGEFVTQDARHPQNRLDIAHLLLWMSATAVVFAAVRPALKPATLGGQVDAETRQFFERRHRNTLTFLPTIAPIWGMGLAAVTLAAWRLVRPGPDFPAQPGHWMLLILGSLVIALLLIFLSMAFDSHPGIRNLLIFCGWLALVFLPFPVSVVAAFRIRGPVHWQLFLRAFAVGFCVFVLGWIASEFAFRSWGYMASTSGSLVAFGGVAVAILSMFGLGIAPLLDHQELAILATLQTSLEFGYSDRNSRRSPDS